LNASIISARFTACVAALVMGLLFAALLSVVLRADRIITARTAELARPTRTCAAPRRCATT
jgi:hypothetical protein